MNKIVLIATILISSAFAQQNQEQQIPPQEPLQQAQPPQQQALPQEQPPQGDTPPPPQEPVQQAQPPQIPPQQQMLPQGYIPQGYILVPQGYMPPPEQQAQQPQQPQPPQPQLKSELKDSVLKDSLIANKDTGKGFYFRLIGGYAFGTGKTSGSNGLKLPSKSVVSSSYSEYHDSFGTIKIDSSTSKTTEKNEAFSLGEGIQFGIGIGYMFNKNIGIDLHGGYLSSSYEIEDKSNTYSDRNVAVSIGNNQARTTRTTSSSSNSETHTIERTYIAITPALRFVAPISDAFSLYSLMGVSIPISDDVVYKYEKSEHQSYYYHVTGSSATNNNSSSQEHKKQEFTSYFELGYSASLGINYSFGKVVNLFVEANVNTASFEAKKGEITEWKQSSTNSNGNNTNVDLLSNMNTVDKETDYQKEYTVSNSSSGSSKNSPKKEVSFSLPASNIGVNSGLMFKF
ncbi:hypothetical protein R83H12_01867 [Fibrobacteria bacterium R8-3-H12]